MGRGRREGGPASISSGRREIERVKLCNGNPFVCQTKKSGGSRAGLVNRDFQGMHEESVERVALV
jgi:hypothetical protein